jgi:hypothetical protein
MKVLHGNYNNYSAIELEKALQSWVEPYPKPIILNHDLNSEPMGRVMAARMDKEEDGSSFVRLQIAITDPVAIQKVLDKRYLTGSVGGRAGKAVCSISGEDLAIEGEGGRPKMPKYRRGQVYKGKLAFIDMQDISFKEYSFVNQPADGKSSIRSINSGDKQALENSNGNWVAKSSAFVLHMDKEEIFSVEENESVLSNLKKKESKPIYLHLKGAFLTALSIQESENYNNTNNSLLSSGEKKISTDSQENEKMNISTNEEDILAVSEELSNDLSSIASESKNEEEVLEPSEEGTDAAPAEESAPEQTQEAQSDKGDEDEEEPAAEEKISDDNSETADEQAQEAVDSEEAEKPEEKLDEDQAQSEERTQEENSLNDEKGNVTESEYSELFEKNKALEEENKKLRSALHRTLVERVVDAKIATGVESAEEREELIEEHSKRTASSLADSLRDLAKMPQFAEAKGSMPEIAFETEIVEGEQNVITVDSEEKAPKESKTVTAEQLFVDALMGRRKL